MDSYKCSFKNLNKRFFFLHHGQFYGLHEAMLGILGLFLFNAALFSDRTHKFTIKLISSHPISLAVKRHKAILNQAKKVTAFSYPDSENPWSFGRIQYLYRDTACFSANRSSFHILFYILF